MDDMGTRSGVYGVREMDSFRYAPALEWDGEDIRNQSRRAGNTTRASVLDTEKKQGGANKKF